MELALSLPEIRECICRFLSHRDRKSCALVSRAWSETMTPWIWLSAKLGQRVPPRVLAVTRKYGAIVRTLHLVEHKYPLDINEWFKNLQALHSMCGIYQANVIECIADLIHRNQSSLLRIHADYLDDENSLVFMATLNCPSLRHLQCTHVTIQERAVMESFVKTCTRLTTLKLDRVRFLEETHLMFQGQTFPSLEQIHLENINDPYLHFLGECPNLKALTIFQFEYISAKDFLEEVITHCRKLCVLDVGGYGFYRPDEFEELALALPPMKYLQGVVGSWSQAIANSITSRHFGSLQAIEIIYGQENSSKFIQSILSSCPNLRFLIGVTINAEDAASGSPWVCYRLEYLQVQFVLPYTEHNLHTAICDRISTLKELRFLNLYSDSFFGQFQAFPLRLGEGLERLASLKKLEHFGVGLLQEEWETEEIEWMDQAWPNLESIRARYHEQDEIYTRMGSGVGSLGRSLMPRISKQGYLRRTYSKFSETIPVLNM
ncbi:hypothetical protein BGW38_003591 [Lunasporangiospora selenospora]|uniref:F-box domain-containing protein n=1 Tax=Lunasporangiospora selenospora TaxID=979761 RepID=A0A9P6G2K8_9FUNG|nr:hypothetical protein BGW38_003591 [Lunasporangiospora selenospora]